MIPNLVLTDEYSFTWKDFTGPINLGMVGIMSYRKRFDRAVDTLAVLLDLGYDARLLIKGNWPELADVAKVPVRPEEKPLSEKIYNRIDSDRDLKSRIDYFEKDNNVPLWYKNVHFILSCSDFESFHYYSVADGVSSGCVPLVWPWEEAKYIQKIGSLNHATVLRRILRVF